MQIAGRKKKEKTQKKKEATYNLTISQLKAMIETEADKQVMNRIEEISKEAGRQIVQLISIVAADCVITHYKDFNRLEVGGVRREERIARAIVEWLCCEEEGYVSLTDLEADLREHGVDIMQIWEEERRRHEQTNYSSGRL